MKDSDNGSVSMRIIIGISEKTDSNKTKIRNSATIMHKSNFTPLRKE